MKKSIIYTVGLGGALGASLLVGGIASSNVFNGEKMPMAGEETIEIEYVETPEQADIVAEEVIDDVVEPKAEIITTEVNECEKKKQEVLDTYGTLDFLAILRRAWNGKGGEHLDQLGVKTWEEFKERFDKEFQVRGATPVHLAELFIKLDNAINEACK